MDPDSAKHDLPISDAELSPGIIGCGRTDVAQRKHNEDAFLVNAELGVVAVADGVGGHHAGEVASRITCEAINAEMGLSGDLDKAVRYANQEVMAGVAAGLGKVGMASTVVAAHLKGTHYQIAWVGDSRTYLWDGQLHLLTRDHSFVAAQLEMGKITLEEARNHPRKNVIVQAIGLHHDSDLKVGYNAGALAPGEVLLLCTDGLNDMLDSGEIATILSLNSPLSDKCEGLIKATLAAGGRDNVTVALIGAEQTVMSTGRRPNVVWSFDPVAARYEGLPELLDDTQLRQPTSTEMSSRPGTTQIMKVDLAEEVRKRNGEGPSPEPEKQPGYWAWLVLGIAGLGTLAVAAMWLLG